MIWMLFPRKVKKVIRTAYIIVVSRITITGYKIFWYFVNNSKDDVASVFGMGIIKAIRDTVMSFKGYESIEDMIEHKAYKYINLGSELSELGEYSIIKSNGLCNFIKLDKDHSKPSPYSGYSVVYINRLGVRYDITPRNEFPDDLPDGDYEVLRLVGSKYESVGMYTNPNQIKLRRRRRV